MRSYKDIIRRLLNKSSKYDINNKIPNLSGDRDLEWTYVAARIGRYANEHSSILDFGCGGGILSYAAASIGAHVLAIDLMPIQFQFGHPNIEFHQADIMSLDEKQERFDLILNCSTIEHVGLSGRYNSKELKDGDIDAMKKMLNLMNSNGHMIITLPLGLDMVVSPLHRIYGKDRFPKLIEGYRIEESSFFKKNQMNIWMPCSMENAFNEQGNDHYYALGMMVLKTS